MRNFIVYSLNVIREIKPRRLRWAGHVAYREKSFRNRNWVDLAQDKNYWRTVANTTLSLRIP